jgi:hypothetical protein
MERLEWLYLPSKFPTLSIIELPDGQRLKIVNDETLEEIRPSGGVVILPFGLFRVLGLILLALAGGRTWYYVADWSCRNMNYIPCPDKGSVPFVTFVTVCISAVALATLALTKNLGRTRLKIVVPPLLKKPFVICALSLGLGISVYALTQRTAVINAGNGVVYKTDRLTGVTWRVQGLREMQVVRVREEVPKVREEMPDQ